MKKLEELWGFMCNILIKSYLKQSIGHIGRKIREFLSYESILLESKFILNIFI